MNTIFENFDKEQVLEKAFENSPNAVFILDSSIPPKIVYCNPIASKMFGYKKEEMLNKTTTFLHIDKDWYKKFQEKIYPSIEKRKHIFLPEFSMKRKDGSVFSTNHSVSVLEDESKNTVGWVSVVRDITDRKNVEKALQESEMRFKELAESLKESEEKYQLLVENANDMIIVAQDGIIKFGNRKMAELLKFSEEEFISKPFTKFIHPDDRDLVLDRHKRRLKGEELPNVYSFRIMGKDAKVYWVEINAITIEWEGRPATLNFLRDITEKKKAEKQKQKLQEQLKKYAKQLETKVKKLEKQKIDLNQKEKLVLTALTCYPGFNDLKLSVITHLKRSTITAIRNRLKERNWYLKINIPNFEVLDYEILSLVYYSKIKILGGDKVLQAAEFIKNNPNALFCQYSKSFGFSLAAYRNATDAQSSFQRDLVGLKFHKTSGGIKQIPFVLPLSSIVRFFDYSNILKKLFNLKFEPWKTRAPTTMGLSKNEKELLYAFTKFPNDNNQKIQEITRLSKPTVIKIKRKLFEEGYLRQAIIPNLGKLGFSFSSLVYKNMDKPIFNKKSVFIHLAKQSRNSFISIIDGEQFLILSVFQDYGQLERSGLEKKTMYQRILKTLETPDIFSFKDSHTVKLDFSAFVKKALNLEVDY